MAETAPQKTEPSVTAVPKEGFGDVLRRVREEQGISLGDMAARSRLSVQQLKAIESESLDQLPEPVYVRAFIRGIAGVLNSTNRHKGLKIAAVAVIVLAVAAGAWCFWNDQFGGSKVQTEAGAPAAEAPAAAPAQKAEAKAPEAAVPETRTEAKPEAKPAEAASESKAAEPVKAEEPAPQAEAAKPVEEKPLTASQQPGVYRTMLTTSAPCWVQIVDPNGKNLLAQEMKAGATVTLDVPKGSKVTVGNAQAMQLMVDGKPFDLAQVTRGGISRFVLK